MRRTVIGLSMLYVATWGLACVLRPGSALLLAAGLAPALIWASAVDFLRFIIPDRAVAAIALVALSYMLATGAPFLAPLIGAAVVFALFWLIGEWFFHSRGREGLGLGDAKLVAALALATGPALLWLLVLIAALGGIVLALIRGRDDEGHVSPVPFGPFLAYAGFLVVLGFTES